MPIKSVDQRYIELPAIYRNTRWKHRNTLQKHKNAHYNAIKSVCLVLYIYSYCK